jgi:methylthioribose-1-phosphate isomerase
VTAAYGVAIAMGDDASDKNVDAVWEKLHETRPTAINLKWALDEMRKLLKTVPEAKRPAAAYVRAAEIAEEDVELNRAMGRHGLEIIRKIAATKKPGEPVNILTHCNAGWLATVDYGTATAPIYTACDEGIAVHVYVDETRPRNQGAQLTAWELANHGVPHTLVVDNAGGHLMQHGRVDMVIVGTDRTTADGDVCNKIGTYLKALAAHDNDVPFYVALPSPTIDWTVHDGVAEIPIEERDGSEVSFVQGKSADGKITRVRISPEATPAANPAFDVTPARLITGLITERGVAKASPQGLKAMFPERG